MHIDAQVEQARKNYDEAMASLARVRREVAPQIEASRERQAKLRAQREFCMSMAMLFIAAPTVLTLIIALYNKVN